MRTLSQKYLKLAGLILASAPILGAQQPSLGLTNESFPTSLSSVQPPAIPENEIANFRGRYTFSLQGTEVTESTGKSLPVSIMGSFIADGNGHIVSGVEDFNSTSSRTKKVALTGSYTLNEKGNGTLTLISSQFTQTFFIFVPAIGGRVQNASLIENDSVFGTSGILNKQEVPASLDGSYNFTWSGAITVPSGIPQEVALAGTLNIEGEKALGFASYFQQGFSDFGNGVTLPISRLPATLTAPDENGRFEITLSLQKGLPKAHLVGYALDPTHFNVLSTDRPSLVLPLLTGSAIR